jgi:hypothetical protein
LLYTFRYIAYNYNYIICIIPIPNYVQGVLKMAHNIYITGFYDETDAKTLVPITVDPPLIDLLAVKPGNLLRLYWRNTFK